MAYNNYKQGTFKPKSTAISKFANAVKNANSNMNRITKQPVIKVNDADSGRKGAQLQTAATSENSADIVKKQKDNTVPAAVASQFSPKVNEGAKAIQTTKGVTKSPNNMNYAKAAGAQANGAGMKPQNPTGIGGGAGSKKVAFATMKKGGKAKTPTAKVAGVTAVKEKNNNLAGAQSQGYNYKKR